MNTILMLSLDFNADVQGIEDYYIIIENNKIVLTDGVNKISPFQYETLSIEKSDIEE